MRFERPPTSRPALAIERQRAPCAAEPARGEDDGLGIKTGQLGGHRRRVAFGEFLQRFEAFGVSCNVIVVEQAFLQHHLQHGVVERDVTARLERQMQICDGAGFAAARIDDDDAQVRICGLGILDTAIDDRVRYRSIRTGDEDALGVIDVFIAARWRIGTERLLVARDGRGHAKTRVGVEVVRTDQAFGQLVEDVIVLGQQLARQVEGDGIGAVATSPRFQ